MLTDLVRKMDNPFKLGLIRISLLSAIVILFIINGFVFYLSLRHHSEVISFLSALTSFILFLLFFIIKWQFNKETVLEAEHKALESQLDGTIKSSKELREMLTFEMQELGIRNEKMSLLIELSEIIQTCNTIPEATQVIETKCRKILHFTSGTLYIMNSKNQCLEIMATWGEPSLQTESITAEECWALRRGNVYQVKKPDVDLICEHIMPSQNDTPYLCIPLMAQNNIIGLLHLDLDTENVELSAENKNLISAVSETLALALANINLRETLRNQTFHDSLTTLYNKRYLTEFLPKTINLAFQNMKKLAILMIDVDFFKQFNDTYGHEAGDLMLAELGKFFQESMRSSDTVCRYGGEEFIVVLYQCDLEDAKSRAEEIRKNATQISFSLNGQMIMPITLSIGISIYPDDAEIMPELIEKADKALYQAKKGNRNKVVAYAELVDD